MEWREKSATEVLRSSINSGSEILSLQNFKFLRLDDTKDILNKNDIGNFMSDECVMKIKDSCVSEMMKTVSFEFKNADVDAPSTSSSTVSTPLSCESHLSNSKTYLESCSINNNKGKLDGVTEFSGGRNIQILSDIINKEPDTFLWPNNNSQNSEITDLYEKLNVLSKKDSTSILYSICNDFHEVGNNNQANNFGASDELRLRFNEQDSPKKFDTGSFRKNEKNCQQMLYSDVKDKNEEGGDLIPLSLKKRRECLDTLFHGLEAENKDIFQSPAPNLGPPAKLVFKDDQTYSKFGVREPFQKSLTGRNNLIFGMKNSDDEENRKEFQSDENCNNSASQDSKYLENFEDGELMGNDCRDVAWFSDEEESVSSGKTQCSDKDLISDSDSLVDDYELYGEDYDEEQDLRVRSKFARKLITKKVTAKQWKERTKCIPNLQKERKKGIQIGGNTILTGIKKAGKQKKTRNLYLLDVVMQLRKLQCKHLNHNVNRANTF